MDSATTAGVARILGTTKQNMNQIIAALEKKGYLLRSAKQNDEREIALSVTDAGMTALLHYAGSGASVLTELFEGFTEEEKEALLRLLRKMLQYDGAESMDFECNVYRLIEEEYGDLFNRILETYNNKKTLPPHSPTSEIEAIARS